MSRNDAAIVAYLLFLFKTNQLGKLDVLQIEQKK